MIAFEHVYLGLAPVVDISSGHVHFISLEILHVIRYLIYIHGHRTARAGARPSQSLCESCVSPRYSFDLRFFRRDSYFLFSFPFFFSRPSLDYKSLLRFSTSLVPT